MKLFYNLLATLVLLILSSNLYAATLTAQLNTTTVIITDSFRLTYTADGSVDGDPDFAPIKHDFQLIGTSTSSNMSLVNGSLKRSKTWTLTLRAKNTGTFIIPAIKFGNDLAPEVEVTVQKTPIYNNSSSNTYSDFIVELEASKETSFIQEQIIITARLFVAKNISSYQFSDLKLDDSDAIINPLGKDRQYKTYRGTKAFIVVERQFAIFPQHKGTLGISPLVADIGISTNQRSRFIDPFNNYTTTKRIQSKDLKIKIKDIPSNFKANDWLPASSLKIIEQWPTNKTFTAGEPITRTITIMADALSSAQLPELAIKEIDNLKQYPDKPLLENKTTGKGISSVRKEKIAYIPTKAGTYTLPAIDIPWWNTVKGKIDIAHISKRTFTVTAATTTPNIKAPTINNTKQQDNLLTDEKIPMLSNDAVVQQITSPQRSYWMWVSLVVFIIWLITLYLLVKTNRKNTKNKKVQVDNTQSLSTSLKYLKIACANNNAQDTKTALLKWAKAVFSQNPPTNLTDLASLLDTPVASKLLALNEALYSNTAKAWQCGELYNLCREYKAAKTKNEGTTNSATLEKL